jgi:hypothetical protein
MSERSEQFNPPDLEILKKPAVMQISHAVNFRITHANGDGVLHWMGEMIFDCDGGAIAYRSSLAAIRRNSFTQPVGQATRTHADNVA